MPRRLLSSSISLVVLVTLWYLWARGQDLITSADPAIVEQSSRMAALTTVELLTFDTIALQERLAAGRLSSVDLVKQCLHQIETHDRRGLGLNAMISVVPRPILMARSKELDQERSNGQTRGPLHGIPMLVKVSDRVLDSSRSGLTWLGCGRYKSNTWCAYDSWELRIPKVLPPEQFENC